MKKLSMVRETQASEWEKFLQLDANRRQQQKARQQFPGSGFGGYKQQGFSDYESPTNLHYGGSNIHMDSRNASMNPIENYPSSRPHSGYGEFQRQRRDGYGKNYSRY